ncbi:uncharacterized protein ACA1_119280 [Acanthamoeba castellanii str. Neff]|uniref:F-box domain-containing protein n=1 Tax=Acanthamoeba castellanii (strain ATCC 30010 / Neff) TaxID=1257118 RepID=L8HKC5_ACACF|nr:uncharacterized protein ACA1_119280 [Acanthamoeba castellanii str. Neff]ELR25650.1 hypothetical protein ACA1_119280 [Acanthamoeba castellanii str. Neff]
MEGLPAEMVVEVLGWVHARDLAGSVPLVCQQWRQLCRQSSLWRLAFLRTWPPPLFHLRPCVSARPPAPAPTTSSSATARPTAGKTIRNNDNIAWKSLCVVEALRSALNVAEHRLFVEDSDGEEEEDQEKEKRNTSEPSPEAEDDEQAFTKKLFDKRTDGEEEDEDEEEHWEKRTTPAVTKKRAAPELDRNKPNQKKAKVVMGEESVAVADTKKKTNDSGDTARPRAFARLLDQERIAAVRNAAERVEEILKPLDHVSYMRQETRFFLETLAETCRRQASVGKGAEARENAHHLFSLLCDHALYSHINVDVGSDTEECFHQVSVLIYSLTTGLPLHINFTHEVDGSGFLSCGLKWERIEGDDFRGENWFSYQDPGLLNALVTYLFGEANVGLISHRDLQAFLQAVLVAHPTVTTFFRLW